MEHSYFWPDVNGDRQYTDDDAAEYAGGFVTHGVQNGDLAVTAGGNMSIVIPAGRAFVGPAWKVRKYYNDSPLTLAIANADGVLNRKDTIVLRSDINTRAVTAMVLTGAFASNPVAPAIVRTAEQYDLKIAEISIPAGTTAITQAMITDTRLDSTVCGIVTGVFQQIDTTTFYNQIQADLAAFKNSSEAGFTSWSDTQKADFNTWFDGIKGILGTDEAANLLNLINDHKADTSAHISTYTHTKTGTVHNLQGTGNNIQFYATADIADGDTWTVNGTAATATLQNGEALPGGLFTPEHWVTGVRLDGTKLGFKSAGGTVKYNAFCQPTEPINKNGIWLKTATAISLKKIVFDQNPYAAGSWMPQDGLPNSPYSLVELLGTYGTKIYYQANISAVYYVVSYDTLAKAWAQLAAFPKSGSYRIDSRGIAQIDSKVYLFGGIIGDGGYGGYGTPTNLSHCYDITTNQFTVIPTCPTNTGNLKVTSTNGKIYIFSGYFMSNGYPSYANAAWEYNPDTTAYKYLKTLPINETQNGGEYVYTVVGYSDKVIIWGIKSSTVGYSYDIASNIYTAIAAIDTSSSHTVVVGDEIFIMGSSSDSTKNRAYAYKPSTNTYRQLPPMTLNAVGALPAKVGNNIFVYAGSSTSAHQCYSLVSKQYPDINSVVLYYISKDASHVVSLFTSKLCDYLPSYFKDAMLYDGTNLLFPELWLGDGTAYTKIREAQ